MRYVAGAEARVPSKMLYAALKRRSSTVVRTVRVGILINSRVKVKGNGQECPFHTRRASLHVFVAMATKPRFLASLGMTTLKLQA
jgi:hypothetical protein